MRREITSLTTLRGIAVCFIIFHHILLLTTSLGSPTLRGVFGDFSIIAMSLFFVLSGVVIHYCYSHIATKLEIFAFIQARFARLFPLYLCFILVMLILNVSYLDKNNTSLYMALFPLNLLGAQSWFYAEVSGTHVWYSMLSGNIAWSISTEAMLYILYIPLAFFMRKLDNLALTAAAILALIAILVRISMLEMIGHSSPWRFWITYISPYGRFPEFMLGVCLATIFMEKAKMGYLVKLVWGASSVLLMVGFLFIWALKRLGILNGSLLDSGSFHTLGFLIALLFVSMALSTSFFDKRRGTLTLYKAGVLSYSAYLLHAFAIIFYSRLNFQHYFNNEFVAMGVILLSSIGLVFLASKYSYRFIELPGKSALQRVQLSFRKTK